MIWCLIPLKKSNKCYNYITKCKKMKITLYKFDSINVVITLIGSKHRTNIITVAGFEPTTSDSCTLTTRPRLHQLIVSDNVGRFKTMINYKYSLYSIIKMTVPGFEPTTSWSSALTTRPRLHRLITLVITLVESSSLGIHRVPYERMSQHKSLQ